LANEGEDIQKVAHETEGGCDPVNSGNARINEPESSGNCESAQQWRLELIQEIEKPTEVPPLIRRSTIGWIKSDKILKGTGKPLLKR
jgi:hypothetical protein